MRDEFTDHEWAAIKPMLPNKPGVAGVNDRRVLNGIFWVLRFGAPWRNQPGKPHEIIRTLCAWVASALLMEGAEFRAD